MNKNNQNSFPLHQKNISHHLAIAAAQKIKEKKYWLNKLSGELEKTIFPYDYLKPDNNNGIKQSDFSNIQIEFSGLLFDRLNQLSNNSHRQLHMILVAGLSVLMWHYSQNKDIIVGTTIIKSKQPIDESKLLNTVLPLRIQLQEEMSFKDLLLYVKKIITEAIENQNYPYTVLEDQLQLQTMPGDSLLFDVGIILENIHDKKYFDSVKPKLIFSFNQLDDCCEFQLSFLSDYYKKSTVKRITDHFIHLIKGSLVDIEVKLKDINILPEEEKNRILFEFNNTEKKCERETCYHLEFDKQVFLTPEKVSVVCFPIQITYQFLYTKANSIASYLLQQGIKANDIVSIYMKRGLEMAMAIHGVFKAGAAYLPIETDYPEDRVISILEDSESKILLYGTDEQTSVSALLEKRTFSHLKDILLLDSGKMFSADHLLKEYPSSNPEISYSSDDLAYIIYTSGTTGKPKGVMIHHLGMLNHLYAKISDLSISNFDIIAQTASACFDISVWQFLAALLVGGRTFIIGKEIVLEPWELLKLFRKGRITISEMVPSLINAFLNSTAQQQETDLSDLRWMIPTGEALTPHLVNEWYHIYPNIKLVNAYGPTEASDDVTHYIVPSLLEDEQITVPIGRPLQNMQIYIMNPYLSLCPIGVRGEICVAGIGVGKGYWKDDVKTKKSFLPNPLINEVGNSDYRIMYKTGDIGYYREDGNIECLGRLDHQVKVRGYRIELEEIELQLHNMEEVKDAVVLAKEDRNNDRFLCGYIVLQSEGVISEDSIKSRLTDCLPDYMVPSSIVFLDKIPLTPNGKIDRKSLPDPVRTKGDKFVAPKSTIELKVAGIWSEILNIKIECIGLNSDFFQLGGNSLSGVLLTTRIHKEFNVKIPLADLFKNPTVTGLINYLQGNTTNRYKAIMPIEKKEYYKASSVQKRLFVLQQMEPELAAYNVMNPVLIEGEIKSEILGNTFRKLIQRHESLRTSFFIKDNETVQKISDEVIFEIEQYEEGESHGNRNDIMGRFVRPFNLNSAPLLRVGLLRLSNTAHILMTDMHHIISDGISQVILIRDFSSFYNGIAIQKLFVQYKDFSQWNYSEEQRSVLESEKKYWETQFEGEVPILNIETDFPRPKVRRFEGNRLSVMLEREKTRDLKRLAQRNDATLYSLLLSLFNILLTKLSGEEDIIVGTPVAARNHADIEPIIGMFVNTLALRNFPKGDKVWIYFLNEVIENTVNALENQDFPFEELVELVSINRDVSRNPLFDVVFVFQNMDFPDIEIPKLKIKPHGYQLSVSKFDLTLDVVPIGDELRLTIEYCSALFMQETIKKMISSFIHIIDAVRINPEIRIAEIEILSPLEKSQILNAFNNTETFYSEEKDIQEQFTFQATRNADRISVVNKDKYISYSELDRRSNRLARVLLNKGVTVNVLAGIMVETSIPMITGMLGIVKAGGAYLPIDPHYPTRRIYRMIKDSAIQVLILQERESCPVNDIEVVKAEDAAISNLNEGPIDSHPGMDTLFYVIYTSGSVGVPKGVLVKQRGFVNMAQFHRSIFEENQFSRVSQVANPSFDAMAFEVWPCLLSGGSLHLVDKEIRLDPNAIKKWLICEKITISFQPTVIAEFLLKEVWPENGTALKILKTGGDKLSFYPTQTYPFKVYNLYGPTEDTIWTTYIELDTKPFVNKAPCIGSPIANHQVYIINTHLNLQPIGVPGELCIGGVGLSMGYLNRVELTSEKFVNFEIKNNLIKRIYKTGDRAKWTSSGTVEFLGRIDYQVKIRGYRIELEEIQRQLLTHEKIKEAVVILKENQEQQKYICAYFVSDETTTFSELKNHLTEELPEYMHPAFFIPLSSIPLTPNGKLDRRALPLPEEKFLRRDIEYIPPQNPLEAKMVNIWEGILGKNRISTTDNFFEIGGDSIKSIQIVSRMKEAGYKIEVSEIFRNPSISMLAPLVKKIGQKTVDQSTVTGIVPLIPIQKWFFSHYSVYHHHFNQAILLYSRQAIEEEAIKAVFRKIQEHHDALRMTYKMEENHIIQENQGLPYNLSLEVYNYRKRILHSDLFADKCNELQASIQLERGPLMKLALFQLNDGDRLLIIIHHLVVDGISWRILFEDLNRLYLQFQKKEKLELSPKTDSYKRWSEGLVEYANASLFLDEKNYWKQLVITERSHIKKDFPEGTNLVKDTASVSFQLGETHTQQLLTRVNEAYQTEITDIILTALGLSVKEQFCLNNLFLMLEGHGREEIIPDIDISRTFGWFTTMYPIDINFFAKEIGKQIKIVKEYLRKIPKKGIGYGILKYLTRRENKADDDFSCEPQILFNYLGQFDTDLKKMSFEIAKESTGELRDKNQEREFEIELSGIIRNQQLEFTLFFSKKQFRTETIMAWLECFQRYLQEIIRFCLTRKQKELTPSDYTFKDLTIDALEGLKRNYPDLTDLYPLTPMQEGMLFHTLYGGSSSTYCVLSSYRIHETVELQHVEKSLKELMKRYDILRTAFVYRDLERPLQLVLRDRPIAFNFQDLRQIVNRTNNTEEIVQKIREDNKVTPFDLSNDTLMRLSVLRLGENEFEFIWGFHHIVMDGWCTSILISEYFEIYTSYKENRAYRLPPVTPYSIFIQWLELKDKTSSKDFWIKYLEGYTKPTSLTEKNRTGKTQEKYQNEEVDFLLSDSLTVLLEKISVNNQVTLNCIFQACWGIILGSYTAQQDVVFGAVVSGRPPEIKNVETIIGLFINTIPVRITFNGKMKFHELVRQVQEMTLDCEQHYHYPLAEIQMQSSLKQDLLDHILAFENFPFADESAEITETDSFEQSSYDLNIIIIPGKQLAIKFKYNGSQYDDNFINLLGNRYKLVLEHFAGNDAGEIAEMDVISDEEINNLYQMLRNKKGKSTGVKSTEHLNTNKVEEVKFNF